MTRPLLIFSQSDYLIQFVDIKSHTWWQTVQIQISWLLQKPTDLDLHCLQRYGIYGFSRTRVNETEVQEILIMWMLNSKGPGQAPCPHILVRAFNTGNLDSWMFKYCVWKWRRSRPVSHRCKQEGYSDKNVFLISPRKQVLSSHSNCFSE